MFFLTADCSAFAVRNERQKGENAKPYVGVVAGKLLWVKRSPGG